MRKEEKREKEADRYREIAELAFLREWAKLAQSDIDKLARIRTVVHAVGVDDWKPLAFDRIRAIVEGMP